MAWLLKNGVPWDKVMDMDAVERLAWEVAFGGFESGKFNWSTGTWEDRT